MQQDSATLIHDLNAMKGTMESYLKKNRIGIQNRILPSLKNRAQFCKSQEIRKLFWATLNSAASFSS